ncbi:MAG: FAD-dependent oxidoreductase [Mariprofundus sp.]|nr:FAD-dependent oxidoreductase [Mariprofundus sp.]
MENRYDMIVVGAGISGLAMAYKAKKAGMSVLVLEKEGRSGGCVHSEVVAAAGSPFWLEMGAHTCYNTYAELLKLINELGLLEQMQGREKQSYRMLDDHKLVSILSRLHLFELCTHFWQLFSLKKENSSISDYYGAIVGEKNYRETFSHAFNAVICQHSADVPADMLFKKRLRDKQMMRSYTFPTGLGDVITALEEQLEIKKEQDIRSVQYIEGRYQLDVGDSLFYADKLVCATPVLAASRLLKDVWPEVAEQLNWVGEVEVESIGVVVEKERLQLEHLAGIIAVDGDFYSSVSRDVIAHPSMRGMTFHFKPGLLDDGAKLEKIATVMGVEQSDFLYIFHKTNRLPAPDMGHHQLIEAVDGALEGKSLALVGNYFSGVSIEDCLERTSSEFSRLCK